MRQMFRLTALVLLALLACKSLTDTPATATVARVIVTGSSTVPLMVVTSTQFVVSRSAEGEETISLTRADTAQMGVPIDRTVPFQGSDRFLVLVRNPDINSTSVLDIRLLIDGTEVLRQAVSLRDASFHFTYFHY
jgi:hypothetical protein